MGPELISGHLQMCFGYIRADARGRVMRHRLTLRRSSMLRYVMLVMMVVMMVLVRSLRKRRVRHQQTHARG